MKNMTTLCAVLFLTPLLLSAGCSKKDDTAGGTVVAGSPVVDDTKVAVDNTKVAVKEGAVATKEAVKDAAVDAKDAVKRAATDTKAAVENQGTADAIAKTPVDNTRAAVDNGEAIKPKDAGVDTKAGEGAEVIAKAPVDDTKAAIDNGEAIKPATVDMNASKQVKARSATPMHQGKDAADMNTTRSVRKAIMADPSLSSKARNVTVTTAKGVVLLRGPVESDAERDSLGATALKFAGKNRVENHLDVGAAN